MTIYRNALKYIEHEMRMNGFNKLECDSKFGIIYYINLGDIAKFYQVDIMKRIGYLRISGSIGFSILDKSINGGLDIEEAFTPKNGCMTSIRLENFSHLVALGSINNRVDNLKTFIEELIVVLNVRIPDNIEEISKSISINNHWISRVLSGTANENQIKMLLKLRELR